MLDFFAHIFISPLNQTALGVIVGILLLKFTSVNKKLVAGIIAISIVWLWLCSQWFFSYWLIAPLEKAFPPVKLQDKAWQKTEAIWVLGCYHYDDDYIVLTSQFSHCSLERLTHAASMYKVKKMPIYLTGGIFSNKPEISHAQLSAKFLIQLGVKKEDIILIEHGNNTLEEVSAIQALNNDQMLAVVSSATHGIRLHSMLSSVGIEHIFIPVYYSNKGANRIFINAPSAHALMRSERAMYEYAAQIKHWIFN